MSDALVYFIVRTDTHNSIEMYYCGDSLWTPDNQFARPHSVHEAFSIMTWMQTNTCGYSYRILEYEGDA